MTIISVNTAIRRRGLSGTARAVEHILRALRGMPEHTVHEVEPSDGLSRSKLRNAVSATAWDWWGAPRAVKSELHVSPCNTGAGRRGWPHLLVMHDTMVLDLPEAFDRGYRLYATALFGASLRTATHVITPSRYSAERVRSRWPNSPEISVVPWPTPRHGHVRHACPMATLRVLMVGATEPHKRHRLGIEAVRLARVASGLDIRLDIVGPAGRAEGEVQAALAASDGGTAWIERHVDVSEDRLGSFYRDAWSLLMTSEAEGYGLPLAEANSWSLPAVHVGAGSMTEVAPGSVRPSDPGALAEGLLRLVDQTEYVEASARASAASAAQAPSTFAERIGEIVRSLTS